MKTAIVWFKTDLRLYDNEALVKQSHKAKGLCIALMMQTFNNSIWFLKNGNYRAQFY
jgi:deoxyribodipyrimidine photo-lyase